MSPPVWCDAAFSHPEVKVRLGDARRARGAEPDRVVCAVVDVLRATTTIVAAFGNGCRRIIPCPSPDAAREKAAALRAEPGGGGRVLLGGEQDARPIPGFDAGNSPLEYTEERIAGRDLVLSTSNGTKTLTAAADCGRVCIVSFGNLSAAARRIAALLEEEGFPALLVACSGREGGYCEEDAVAAGLLIGAVADFLGDGKTELSDTARAALRAAGGAGDDMARMLRESWWGKHLAGLGLLADINFCGRRDWTEVVPQMRAGEITPD
ncbi:MAG: 2-phosphosulfolactate phosphatase [bacterium]